MVAFVSVDPQKKQHRQKKQAAAAAAANGNYSMPLSARHNDNDSSNQEVGPYETVLVSFNLEKGPQIGIQHSVDPSAADKLETFSYAKLNQPPEKGPGVLGVSSGGGGLGGGIDELLCVRLCQTDFAVEHFTPSSRKPCIQYLSFQRYNAPPPPPPSAASKNEPRLINIAVRDETGLKSFVVLQTWPFSSLVDAYVTFHRRNDSGGGGGSGMSRRPIFKLDRKPWEKIEEETSIQELGLQSGDILDVWITVRGDDRREYDDDYVEEEEEEENAI